MLHRNTAVSALMAVALLTGVATPQTTQPTTVPATQPAERKPVVAEPTWETLFDGTSLHKWQAAGAQDAWGIENGELVITRPGHGGWLQTTRMFRDFELELEFNVPVAGNSGVGLRGSRAGDPAFTGFEVQIFDSHGQEPADNNCGAIYAAVKPASMAVNPAGEWNTYRITLVGDVLNVWLNDQPIHENVALDERGYIHDPANKHPLRDRMPTGYISLQDHGDRVRFRNIRIRDLSSDPDPGDLQNLPLDDHLQAWFMTGKGTWTVENNTLVGRDGPGHLFLRDLFTDFELRSLVKVNANGNSGIYFHARPNPADINSWPQGYEAQIDNHDPQNFTGCLYDRAHPKDIDAPITRDGVWFDYRIVVEGQRIRTWVNGRLMVDATLDAFSQGLLALQTHHEGNEIMFRDLRIARSDPKLPNMPPTQPAD